VFLLFVVLTFLGESFAGSGLFILPQHHAGTDDGQDDETKQDDSKGRKTNNHSHVDVDVHAYKK
jgi:hypothetical protein